MLGPAFLGVTGGFNTNSWLKVDGRHLIKKLRVATMVGLLVESAAL